MSSTTRGEQPLVLPLAQESGTSSCPLWAQPDQGTEEPSPPNASAVEDLLATKVDPERLTEKEASTPKSPKSPVGPVSQKSSARSKLSVAVVPSTGIQGDGFTRSQASTLHPINDPVNPIPQASSAKRNHPVAVVPPPTPESREIEFSSAKPSLRGYVSEPKGLPQYIGGFSDVWRCRVRFSASSEVLPREVAVKALRLVGDCSSPDTSIRLQKRLEQEIRTWNGIDHPNIVALIGWIEGPRFWLIAPWYNQGSLDRHLALSNLSKFERIRLLLAIAKALEYLHSRSPPVVHGDIKPGNILLSDQGEPLLADFGLATILGEEETYTSSHHFGGSTPWMSPECIKGESRSCEGDVYSFGSLAFTVMTGTNPYDGLNHNLITLRIFNDKDPKGPVEDWTKYPQLQGSVKDLLVECWARSPNTRPSMPVVVKRLTALLASYESGNPTVSSEPETRKGLNTIRSFFAAVIFISIGMMLYNGRFSNSTAPFDNPHKPLFVHPPCAEDTCCARSSFPSLPSARA